MSVSLLSKGCFENHRHVCQRFVVHQALEQRNLDLAVSEIGMPIAVGAQAELGVVEMNAPEAVRNKQRPQLAEEVLIDNRVVESITGSVCVTGVDADADSLGNPGEIPNPGQVFESKTDERSLSGSILEQDLRLSLRALP